ncbi:MAG: sulfite exporter TauE/SafE family protein, partial [Bacteroidota bacterium]
MEWMHIAILIGAGLGTGFLVGLVGVGGGVIFAPVLLYYYKAVGISPDVVATLTVATSLFCVLLAASSSAWHQLRRHSARLRTAIGVGLASAAGVMLAARLITTQPWFDARVFQVVFGAILLVSVMRMVMAAARPKSMPRGEGEKNVGIPAMAATGISAGVLSSVAGVGGGIILVPIYNNLYRYPIHLATGTSSATIVLTAISGVLTYMVAGWGIDLPSLYAIGYVDVLGGLMLAVPAFFTTRFGVWAAHRLPRRALT